MKPLLLLSVIGLIAFAGAKHWPVLSGPQSPAEPPGLSAVIYLDPSVSDGWAAEEFFRSRGVHVEVWDVTQNASAHAEYIRIGGGPLPVIRLGSERLSGFDRRTAERVLDRLERSPLVN